MASHSALCSGRYDSLIHYRSYDPFQLAGSFRVGLCSHGACQGSTRASRCPKTCLPQCHASHCHGGWTLGRWTFEWSCVDRNRVCLTRRRNTISLCNFCARLSSCASLHRCDCCHLCSCQPRGGFILFLSRSSYTISITLHYVIIRRPS